MAEFIDKLGLQDTVTQIKGYVDNANSEKQDTLVSGENIKTINGNSILGEGNLPITTYQPFPASWTTNSTIATLMNDVENDASAVVGMSYLGEVTCSDLPFSGNAELTIAVMNGSGTDKVLLATLTSGNIAPYLWQYSYWNNQGSGWRAFGNTEGVVFNDYAAMVTALNAANSNKYQLGQSVYVTTADVPDVWISSVEASSSTYTYVDDATLVNALKTTGYVQMGYYVVRALEGEKPDLSNYVSLDTTTQTFDGNKTLEFDTNRKFRILRKSGAGFNHYIDLIPYDNISGVPILVLGRADVKGKIDRFEFHSGMGTGNGTIATLMLDNGNVKNIIAYQSDIPAPMTEYQVEDVVNNSLYICYDITTTVTNGTYVGNAKAPDGATAKVVITPDTGYELPSTVTVTNATSTYDNLTGEIEITNPTGAVTITATCTTVQS